MGRLVHTSLGSSYLIAHVLHCPPIRVAYAIVALLAYLVRVYTRDFASRVRAQQRGLTVERLEWAYLLFICTGLSICFVPSFANWWSATSVIGLVLILPRAWDVCFCCAVFVLCVSCALPLTVNFIDTTVLSMLTEFPVLCSTSILPLLANVIGATVVILVVYAVHTCVYLVEKIYFGIIVLYSDWSFPRNVEELYINILDLVICFLESIIFFLPPPRTQLYNRSCSNKHTPEAEITILPPREQLCTRSCSNKTHT